MDSGLLASLGPGMTGDCAKVSPAGKRRKISSVREGRDDEKALARISAVCAPAAGLGAGLGMEPGRSGVGAARQRDHQLVDRLAAQWAIAQSSAAEPLANFRGLWSRGARRRAARPADGDDLAVLSAARTNHRVY